MEDGAIIVAPQEIPQYGRMHAVTPAEMQACNLVLLPPVAFQIIIRDRATDSVTTAVFHVQDTATVRPVLEGNAANMVSKMNPRHD